jgi:hypothetical protein
MFFLHKSNLDQKSKNGTLKYNRQDIDRAFPSIFETCYETDTTNMNFYTTEKNQRFFNR